MLYASPTERDELLNAFPHFVKLPSEFFLIFYQAAKFLQGESVGAFGEIELKVAILAIFLYEVVMRTAVVLLTRQLWIMRQAVLQAAAHDGVDINQSVGLCHDKSVDASWLMVGRGAMVFCRLSYGFYFVGGKPLAQLLVFSHDASRHEVMPLTSLAESKVVVGCCRHDECGVGLGVMLCHLCAAPHDALYVVEPVGCVKLGVAWENALMEVFLEGHEGSLEF